MTDMLNLATRCIEEACDKAARKGARSEDLTKAMLSIFVATRVGFGASRTDIVKEVDAAIEEMQCALSTVPVEIGPKLGDGGN